MTMPSVRLSSKIAWTVRSSSSQSLSTRAWLGRRRNGTSWIAAMFFSSGIRPRSSPSLSRFPASMYQARSSRSVPTESMVPPVRIKPTLGKAAILVPSRRSAAASTLYLLISCRCRVSILPRDHRRRLVSLRYPCALVLGECVQVLIAVPAEVGGRSQSPYRGRIRPGPDRRSLRVALVPGAGLEISKLFFLHLIELRVELDDVVVRIAVIDENVMADPMTARPPDDRPLLASQNVARGQHVAPVFQLVGDMVHEGR